MSKPIVELGQAELVRLPSGRTFVVKSMKVWTEELPPKRLPQVSIK
jgi:hypothetical protein